MFFISKVFFRHECDYGELERQTYVCPTFLGQVYRYIVDPTFLGQVYRYIVVGRVYLARSSIHSGAYCSRPYLPRSSIQIHSIGHTFLGQVYRYNGA